MKKAKTLFVRWTFALLAIISFSCKNYETKCNSLIFKNSTSDTSRIMKHVFLVKKIGEINPDGLCEYEHSFIFWRGIEVDKDNYRPAFKIEGKIYLKENVIYLKPKGQEISIPYFDFNLSVDDTINVQSRIIKEIEETEINLVKNYSLALEDKFNDPQLNDTVYKFKFSRYYATLEDDYLIFYITKTSGVLGILNGINTDSGKVEILSSRGNIYKERMDLNNTLFDPNLE